MLIYIDVDSILIVNNWPAVQSARLIDEFLRVNYVKLMTNISETRTNLRIKGQIKGYIRNPVASKFRLPTKLLSLNLKDDCNNSSNMNNDKRAMISRPSRVYNREIAESLRKPILSLWSLVTKPPWWPSRVSYRELDRLPKVGRSPIILQIYKRIRLLVYILRELRISHRILVAKL
ncbi:hypothetical protein N7522_005299 [Penicillium canescens]|nr:hypothetical protein N7522_005299 [Penicillium canescens]